MPMSVDIQLSATPTTKTAYDGIRELTMQASSIRVEGPLPPWGLLKSRLPRQPRVFVLVPNVAVGDEAPFMRLIHVR